ncbi:MAG: FAD-binding protein [Verrucomicrobiales bacterium]|nr:FAD-binding protein [Verrucomicrobiales bacterium]
MMPLVDPPGSIEELREVIRSATGPVIARGAGTKSALLPREALRIPMTKLSGVVEYEPSEYTFTALAGTPVREVSALLSENGQYLPFDPPFAESGTTLGGIVAANASGPGRLRYGGVRDFVIGVRFVDGTGRLLRGGGKVVKNAAGFDFSKLLCGSMGRLGVLTEVSFKVFPAPAARRTARIHCQNLADAVACVCQAAGQAWEAEALEIHPPDTVLLRLMGDAAPLASRMDAALRALQRPAEILTEAEAAEAWQEAAEFSWMPQDAMLVKIPLTPSRVEALNAALRGTPLRYSQAGNVAFGAWQGPPQRLHDKLRSLNCAGVVWKGSEASLRPGAGITAAERLVKRVFDPPGRFPDFPSCA